MNGAQLHLLLNHVPVIGIPLIVLILAAGTLARSAPVLRLGLGLAVLVAVVSIGTFVSGEPAEEVVESVAGISKADIERHEGAARPAMAGIAALGLVAAAGLVALRRPPAAERLAWSALALGLVVASWLAWTAHLGGLIHHSELRSAQAGAPAAQSEGHERHEADERD